MNRIEMRPAAAWLTFGWLFLLASFAWGQQAATTRMGWPLPPSSETCWETMPQSADGAKPPLPSWIRMVAREMPKTAAAFLELDYAHRVLGPVDRKLRAAMRWTTAKANGSLYAMEIATLDAERAGVDASRWKAFTEGDRSVWGEGERAAIEFARGMTLDSDAVTDEQFSELVRLFDDRTAAAMVLHQAYANFQDRLLICLGIETQEGEPMAPVAVRFSPDSLVRAAQAPSNKTPPQVGSPEAQPKDIIEEQEQHTWLPYERLQERLQTQRARKTRLRVPDWQEFAAKLPEGLMPSASDIVWYKVSFGYAHELAVPFEIYLRAAGSEISQNWDRPFGNCLFWMVTDAVKCPYCMGHCEMNWEVTGLSKEKIADLSRQLAGNDWSAFSQAEQKALDLARQLTRSARSLTKEQVDALRSGFGDQRAFFMLVNISRYNYMTRISNGFQLTLETGNPFYQYYNMKPKGQEEVASKPRPTPVDRETTKRLLEEMKERRARVELPPVTEEERSQNDARGLSYESRLTRLFLPGGSGARGYLNFGGMPPQARLPSDNRPVQEPDPALTLDYGFKTRLFWIASRVNNCQYCLGHQESKLQSVGMTDDQIAALDLDWSQFPPSEQAAFGLARRLTREPHRLVDSDVDACRKDFTDLQILEMILSVAGNNAINRWKEGVGVPQSKTGGNFGASNTEEHSYLTATNPILAKKKSVLLADDLLDASSEVVETRGRQEADVAALSVEEGLRLARDRKARFPLPSVEQTRVVFGDLEIPEKVPNWIRLLANFPVAGKRQVAALLAVEQQLDLSDLTRARLAWVIARQNGAWYALAEAQSRLESLGQSGEQIAELERFELVDSERNLTARDRALLTVAKQLAASPVQLTDAQAQWAIELAGPREFVQAVHYTAMRSLLDRFTEASGLPID
ncbi:MAG: hypothetical protein ACK57Y_00410 [Pirellulaceae bacterium]